ncbi:MAG: Maf family nucleotide pyrophosphatase [Muribaculaceae bacterium]|nr:Maf family nucleotide pyrophosphatase [Muribaculaceae bacterium]
MTTPPRVTDVTIALASKSPRRRELLGMVFPDVRIAPVKDVEENYPADLPAHEVPQWLSRLKAAAHIDVLNPGEILLTADTVVIIDGEILGKPADEEDACRMLERLAGNTHTVVTGVTLSDAAGAMSSFSDTTDVEMTRLSAEEIKAYVDVYKPLDKAGAYGIQEWIGGVGIKAIHCSFYNVMGLPLHAVYREVRKMLGHP